MGVSCIDNVAPNEGATCGSCPTGFSGNGVTCEGTHFLIYLYVEMSSNVHITLFIAIL